jgi:hypothetical protein
MHRRGETRNTCRILVGNIHSEHREDDERIKLKQFIKRQDLRKGCG